MRSSRVVALFASLVVASAAYASDPSPVGRWLTIDDKDGKPRSVVDISETGGVLQGKVVTVYDRPGDSHLCTKCSGDLRNKPILGMVILAGLKPDGEAWDGGSIVDPDSGDVYSATLRLAGSGSKLIVRGYLGISLFGRSQTWVRETIVPGK